MMQSNALPTNIFNALWQIEYYERCELLRDAYQAAFSELSSSDQIELEPLFDYMAHITNGMSTFGAKEMIANLGMLLINDGSKERKSR